MGRIFVLALVAAAALFPVSAEDVEKKFRIGVAVGGYNATDEVNSQAANVLTLTDELFLVTDQFVDPRDDSAVFGNLDIQPGVVATVYGQYALSKIFIIEASVGYQKTDVGDVEVQAQFDGVDIPDLEDFVFSIHRVPVGDLERIPVQVTAMARFRPRASFNPYVGLGVGYTFIGFEPAAAFSQLSQNMDSSLGGQTTLSSGFFGNPSINQPAAADIGDLEGARVDARDTFEWHLAGGAELSIRRKWALFLDIRFTVSSRSLFVGFNGEQDLGISVPNLIDFETSPAASQTYGPMQITAGGLVDGGSLVPLPGAPMDTDCTDPSDQIDCVFDPTVKDGQLDTGSYYAQGGSVDYGGFGLQVGFRYTF